MPSYRKMAEDTDIKFNRVMDLLKGQNGVPTLQEFISLCLLFGHRPSDAMDEVMRHVEMQRTMSADEARVEETKRLLRENPMALTAYHDPDKQHYIDGDGIDPA